MMGMPKIGLDLSARAAGFTTSFAPMTRHTSHCGISGLDPRGVQTRTVDMAVARLREALDDDPTDPRVIETVRAKGYMLATVQA